MVYLPTLELVGNVPQTIESFSNLVQNAIVYHTSAQGAHYESAWDPTPYLNQWIPLPFLGGNSVLLRKAEGECSPLVMFPRLTEMNLEFWFYSRRMGQMTDLREVDGIKPCPAGQLWPYCQWCSKFH